MTILQSWNVATREQVVFGDLLGSVEPSGNALAYKNSLEESNDTITGEMSRIEHSRVSLRRAVKTFNRSRGVIGGLVRLAIIAFSGLSSI